MGDYKVADISLADFGRKELRLAEVEMPGLMVRAALRSLALPPTPRVRGALLRTRAHASSLSARGFSAPLTRALTRRRPAPPPPPTSELPH
jgi:hypothetical protein